jgi:hypothetical protein
MTIQIQLDPIKLKLLGESFENVIDKFQGEKVLSNFLLQRNSILFWLAEFLKLFCIWLKSLYVENNIFMSCFFLGLYKLKEIPKTPKLTLIIIR